MKKFFKILTLLVIVLGFIFIMGPRPQLVAENTFESSSLGDDLDKYLAEREANIPNITKGTEKEIVWANPSTKEQTDIAIIYLHGFSASKPETRPVPDMVAKAIHANLYFTRFTGGGRDLIGLDDSSISGWITDYAEAIAIGERIGKKIIIMATSNGASVAVFGLNKSELSKNVIGLITVSGAFELQRISNFLANIPWSHSLFPLVMGDIITWKPANEEQTKYWNTEYHITATYPMMTMMNHVWHMDKSNFKIPALFVYSPNDRVVRPDAILKTANEWGGKVNIFTVEKSATPFSHVIAGDIMNPGNNDKVANAMIEWIKGL